MGWVSTTTGRVWVDPPSASGATQNVQTTDVYESMEYEDEEDGVAQVLSATGVAAVFEDGTQEELLFWVVTDSAEVYGVALPAEGSIDLGESVEAREGFQKYEQANNNDKEI